MNNPISIVIPTFHRKESLFRLLKNISDIGYRGEVVVVEQEERHATEIVALAKKLSLSIVYVYMKHASTARAMNLGVAHASGDVILFLDDDVLGSPGFISHHLANFSDTHIGATVGRCITNGQPVEADAKRTGRINWLGSFTDGFSSTIRQEVDTVIGCNTCIRKDVYQKVGGIDERFTGNALRLESDLSLRIKKMGYSIIFDPTAEITHLREPTGGARKTEGRIQWYFDFFSNETYFSLKHRPVVLLPLFLLTKISWACRCMFGFGREVSMRSLKTPFMGIRDGIHKYAAWTHMKRLTKQPTGAPGI